MKFSVLILLTFFFLPNSYSSNETTVEVTSVQGDVVVVSASEIQRAYTSLIKNKINQSFKGQFINSDGSVSMVQPFFLFAGQKIRIAALLDHTDKSGVCKYFGYTYLSDLTDSPIPSEEKTAHLDIHGKLKGVGKSAYAVDIITCRD